MSDHREAIGLMRAEETQSVLRLLERSGLPLDGLADHFSATVVARENWQVVGCAALELYPDGALLRSVAVAPEAKGRGLGAALTGAAISLARSRTTHAIYLLTTTAEQFFPRFGFEVISRTDVPAGVKTSVEFAKACPSTAVVMRMLL